MFWKFRFVFTPMVSQEAIFCSKLERKEYLSKADPGAIPVWL